MKKANPYISLRLPLAPALTGDDDTSISDLNKGTFPKSFVSAISGERKSELFFTIRHLTILWLPLRLPLSRLSSIMP